MEDLLYRLLFEENFDYTFCLPTRRQKLSGKRIKSYKKFTSLQNNKNNNNSRNSNKNDF